MKIPTYLTLLFALMAGGIGASEPAKDRFEKLDDDGIRSAVDGGEVFVLDVRETDEIAKDGTVSVACHIPSKEVADRLDEIPKDRPILVACQGGGRASRTAALLTENGYRIHGYCGLQKYGGPKVYPEG